jgi:hypothetical protein
VQDRGLGQLVKQGVGRKAIRHRSTGQQEGEGAAKAIALFGPGI